ncbi:MAG: hypothetical protein IPL83_15910 [Bdellovibrionales bacterium]|nr:hypothetical protein [Bdellovibrionales bacterium]
MDFSSHHDGSWFTRCDYRKFEFDRSKLSLRVFARQDRAFCLCHQCGNQIGYVHEWKERSLRAPPFGAFLYVEVILFQLGEGIV